MQTPVIMTQSSNIKSEDEDIIHLPFIKIKPLSFNEALLNHHYDWIIFSSKNAVKYFRDYFQQLNVDYVAAIGEKRKITVIKLEFLLISFLKFFARRIYR